MPVKDKVAEILVSNDGCYLNIGGKIFQTVDIDFGVGCFEKQAALITMLAPSENVPPEDDNVGYVEGLAYALEPQAIQQLIKKLQEILKEINDEKPSLKPRPVL